MQNVQVKVNPPNHWHCVYTLHWQAPVYGTTRLQVGGYIKAHGLLLFRHTNDDTKPYLSLYSNTTMADYLSSIEK